MVTKFSLLINELYGQKGRKMQKKTFFNNSFLCQTKILAMKYLLPIFQIITE